MSLITFKQLKSVNNPTSIHGIYPYRGKISSVEAKLIVEQLPKGSNLLDPFCGTGTILFEGSCNSLNVFGVDNNPLAIHLSKGKMDSLNKNIEDITEEVDYIIDLAKRNSKQRVMPPKALGHFHPETANEIMKTVDFIEDLSDYLKASLFGAIALSARGCNHYKWTSSTVGKDINPKRYIPFFEKFRAKVKKHHPKKKYQNADFNIYLNDSRKLSEFIPKNSIDFVFTSPPYFDGLDYTAYYGKIIYWILEMNRDEIRKGLIQTVSSYEDDMKQVLSEIVKVTKDKAQIIFVVGDKKVGKETINGGEFFSNLLHHKPDQIIERQYTGTSSQVFDKLNKTKRKEQIVIWNKGNW
jgi:16S rRNA G966 N2-methylase RsmD